MSPAIAPLTASPGSALHRNSRPKSHTPANAPAATISPKVMTSKLPILKRTGYTRAISLPLRWLPVLCRLRTNGLGPPARDTAAGGRARAAGAHHYRAPPEQARLKPATRPAGRLRLAGSVAARRRIAASAPVHRNRHKPDGR